MRRVTYFCDRCGVNVNGRLYQIGFRIIDTHTGEELEEEFNAEFCPDCYQLVDDAVAQAVMGKREELKTISVPAAETKPTPKTKREPDEKILGKKARDMGKVHALLDAGWSREKIGIEFGVSGQTISNWLKEEKEAMENG